MTFNSSLSATVLIPMMVTFPLIVAVAVALWAYLNSSELFDLPAYRRDRWHAWSASIMRTLIAIAVVILAVAISNFALNFYSLSNQNISTNTHTLTIQELTEALRPFLPNLKLQAEQHQELIQTIKQAQSLGPTVMEPETAVVGLSGVGSFILYLSAFSMIMLGSLLTVLGYWLWKFQNRLAAGIISSAAGAAVAFGGFSLGGVTLVGKVDKLFPITLGGGHSDVPTKIEIVYQPPQGPRGEPGPQGRPGDKGDPGEPGGDASKIVGLDCGESDSQRIGTFVVGSASKLEDEKAGVKKIQDVGEKLKMASEQRALLSLVLVGSADKRPLSGALLKEFGSNAGLAQARAKWVKDRLPALFPGNREAIVAVYGGPLGVGLVTSRDVLAFDRAVQVCAFWGADLPMKAANPTP
jgi:hypothetical protein